MNSFEEIIERVKDSVSIKHGMNKVFDKDVAFYLGISSKKLSRYKKENRIPMNELSYFCYREDVSIDWLLFDKKEIRVIRQKQKELTMFR